MPIGNLTAGLATALFHPERVPGGAPLVHAFIGLAPVNHGNSLSNLLTPIQQLGLVGGFNGAAAQAAPSLVEREAGSAFMRALFAAGDTVPGPYYVVILTRRDAVACSLL